MLTCKHLHTGVDSYPLKVIKPLHQSKSLASSAFLITISCTNHSKTRYFLSNRNDHGSPENVEKSRAKSFTGSTISHLTNRTYSFPQHDPFDSLDLEAVPNLPIKAVEARRCRNTVNFPWNNSQRSIAAFIANGSKYSPPKTARLASVGSPTASQLS